ncbi:DUF4398 and OmpA-like domain-containing protein [Myxococcaceae bacterium JPH2]|nr:DUF4398 and OmpA-like domain-containing protein [Myxococcaceae bacterium JPH2]
MLPWKHGWKVIAGALALTAVGCAHAPAPRELVEARSAYQRTAESPEGQARPKDVAAAREALKQAENEYAKSQDSARTRSLSYVALRKAQLAQVRGGAELAAQQQAQSQQALLEAQQQQQQRTQAELDSTRQQLAAAENARQEAERQRSEAHSMAQTQQSASQQQLESERQARAEAEQRAQEAVSQLDKLSNVKVKEEARGTVVTLSGSVLFASGQTDLLPSARNRLGDVAGALKESSRPLLIEGHTDSQGSDAFNEQLSLHRAERVRDYLVSQGVPADRIEVRGLGEYQPVASNRTAEGRANNRRVEIVVERGVANTGATQSGGVGGSGAKGEQPPHKKPSHDKSSHAHPSHESSHDGSSHESPSSESPSTPKQEPAPTSPQP